MSRKRLAIRVRYSPLSVIYLGMLVLVSACATIRPLSHGTESNPARYRVLALTSSHNTTIVSDYRISLSPSGVYSRIVKTDYTSGEISRGDENLQFDSRSPSPSDPWPLRIQHTVSAIPAHIRFSSHGRPDEIVDPGEWKKEVVRALGSLGLPGSPDMSENPAVDSDSLLHNLRELFPGTSVIDGSLTRAITVAGVSAIVTEKCTHLEPARGEGWHCTGSLDSIGTGHSRIFGISTASKLQFDRGGMASFESEYSGTSVGLEPSTGELLDLPVAGKRLVERQ